MMLFLYNYHGDMWSNIREGFQHQIDEGRFPPKQVKKLRTYLLDMLTLVFGVDSIDADYRVSGDTDILGHTCVVSYSLQKPFVGINQTRGDEPLTSNYKAQVTVRYIRFNDEWELLYWAAAEHDFTAWNGVMMETNMRREEDDRE